MFTQYERSFVKECAFGGSMDYLLLRKCIEEVEEYYDFVCKLYPCEGSLPREHPKFRNCVIAKYQNRYVYHDLKK